MPDSALVPIVGPNPCVQFSRLLSEADFVRVAQWLEKYPKAELRAFGSYDRSIKDLEFLRFFPKLRRFSADCLFNHLASLDGLRHLPEDLEDLSLGITRRKLDLSILERFRKLKSLHLEGQTKRIEVVASLTSLETLSLRSISLPDLALLRPLNRLRVLLIKLGGTKSLDHIEALENLRYLELWQIRGLSDVRPIQALESLHYLFLQALARVEKLPSMNRLTQLRGLEIWKLKNLRDLTPIAAIPNLRELYLSDMTHLCIDDFRPLLAMSSLENVVFGLGSKKMREEVYELFGLPSRTREKCDWLREVGGL